MHSPSDADPPDLEEEFCPVCYTADRAECGRWNFGWCPCDCHDWDGKAETFDADEAKRTEARRRALERRWSGDSGRR